MHCVFVALLKMAQPHSKLERQRLKRMLSDAIRVLCQNTVRYNVDLSIEALIGITVDGGTDVVIVSLNEMIGKQAADTTFGEEQYYDTGADNQYTDEQADYMEDENGYYPDDEYADQEYDTTGESAMPYGTVVKKELMSTITYDIGGGNNIQPASTSASTQYKMEPYFDNTQQYYNEPVNQHNVGLQQGRPSAARPVTGKSRSGSSGVQKRPKLANPGATKPGRVGSKASVDGSGQRKPAAAGNRQSLSGGDVVCTVYTCGTCGAQVQNYTSFMRHKRSHTEQHTCRCEGCGKLIKRHDNLLKHQRLCPAYLGQFQHGDPGI